MSEESVRTLGAVIHENFELLDLYGPLEMFGCVGPELRIVTVAEQKGPVRSTPGPETVASHSFGDCPELDLVLLPGGIGTLTQLENPAILDFLRERSQRAELTMTVCTGSALLAKSGALDGRKATSNKLYFDLARAQSAEVDWVEDARWVEDGSFVTASGVSAGTDMALSVIARLFGAERAERIAIMTEYEWSKDPSRDPFHVYLNKAEAFAP